VQAVQEGDHSLVKDAVREDARPEAAAAVQVEDPRLVQQLLTAKTGVKQKVS
jgi:hypothetical protein